MEKMFERKQRKKKERDAGMRTKIYGVKTGYNVWYHVSLYIYKNILTRLRESSITEIFSISQTTFFSRKNKTKKKQTKKQKQ